MFLRLRTINEVNYQKGDLCYQGVPEPMKITGVPMGLPAVLLIMISDSVDQV